MKLKEVGLWVGEDAGLAKQVEIEFLRKTHHVMEILSATLPKDFELDGNKYLTIVFGQSADYTHYNEALGVSLYPVPDFDFQRYFAIESCERDKLILNHVRQVLMDIIERSPCSEDRRPIIETLYKQIVEHRFKLVQEVKKLSKLFPDRTRKIQVFRHLSAENGEAWRAVVTTRTAGQILKSEWITSHPDYLNRTEVFSKALWKSGRYLILDRLGSVSYSLTEKTLKSNKVYCFED